jgi:hypothetical protein
VADEELNPYAASHAPVAAEEVPPSRIRFYMICLACAIGLTVLVVIVQVFKLSDALTWTSMLVTWLVGVLWILQPELRRDGGIRNVSLKQLLVTVFGVPVFTGTLLFILLVVAAIVSGPFIA